MDAAPIHYGTAPDNRPLPRDHYSDVESNPLDYVAFGSYPAHDAHVAARDEERARLIRVRAGVMRERARAHKREATRGPAPFRRPKRARQHASGSKRPPTDRARATATGAGAPLARGKRGDMSEAAHAALGTDPRAAAIRAAIAAVERATPITRDERRLQRAILHRLRSDLAGL